MASKTTETNTGNGEGTGPSSEPNEHDYAHTTDSNFTSTEASSFSAPTADGVGVTQESCSAPAEPEQGTPGESTATLSVELPEPAVGAEVDCPGGNDVEVFPPPQTEDGSQKMAPPQLAVVASTVMRRGGRRRSMRPEDRSCSSCKTEFERHGRSFNRRAVYTFTTPETVHWAFPDTAVTEKSFLCETCAQVIRSKGKRKQSGKRSLWLKPPVIKQSELRDKKKMGPRMGKKSKAAQLVSKSCYKAAFKMLWSAKGARKPMMEFWSRQLKEEMRALTRQTDSPFLQKVSNRKPLSSFPWRRCLNWAQDKAPLVTTCLTSLFPDISALSKSSNQLSEEQAQTLLERRAVVALSIPLFTRNIWKNNFLQAALGAELRLQGCSGAAIDALNTLGLCQNKDTVRLLLQRLQNSKKVNGRQSMMAKHEQGDEQMTDVEEEEEEEEEDDDEEEEEVEEDDEDDEMEIVSAEEEEGEMQDGVQEEEAQAAEEKAEMEKKRRKKAKKQRKEEKRKERGKRKAKEREDVEDEEDSEEQKKKRVVVVRLDLLKGHSEVGRSDLSAP